MHIVQEFNKGVYDYIIATDESADRGEVDATESTTTVPEAEEFRQDDDCKVPVSYSNINW